MTSRRYFDPFGRTSSANGSDHLSNTQFGDLLETNRYRRGFTDHEHLNEQQLIHMNGRIYDYNVGRFMSVDPFIQAPTSTQSINPYSYIMNNPLAGTDPTGYMGKCDQNPTCQMQSFFSSTGSGGSSLIGHLMGRLKTTLSNGHDTKRTKQTKKASAAAKVKSPAAISFVLDKEVSKNSANNIHLKGCGGRYQCSNAYNEFLGMDPIAKEAANKTLGTIVETADTVSDVVAPVKGLAKQGAKRLIRRALKGKKPTTRTDLHDELTDKGFELKGVSPGGNATYKGPDGIVVTVKPSGEVIRTQKVWKSDGSKKYPERQDFDGTRLPDQSHQTGHFVEPLEGPIVPPKKG